MRFGRPSVRGSASVEREVAAERAGEAEQGDRAAVGDGDDRAVLLHRDLQIGGPADARHVEQQPVLAEFNALLRNAAARTTAAQWAAVGRLLGRSPSSTYARHPGRHGSKQAG